MASNEEIILEGKCGDWLVCGAIFGPTQQTAGTLANQVPSSSTAVASINSSCDTISSQYRGLPKKYSSMMVTGVQYEVFSSEDEDVCPPHALKVPDPVIGGVTCVRSIFQVGDEMSAEISSTPSPDILNQDENRVVGIGTLDNGRKGRHTRDPSILPSSNLSSILDGLEKGIPTKVPTVGYIIPSSGAFFSSPTSRPILGKENIGPERSGFRVHSPTQATQEGFILNSSPLHAKHTIFFRESDGVPSQEMHFPFGLNGAPDQVSLGSINLVEHAIREMDVLHNMIKSGSQRRFG
ncbi:hypothetical protein T459_23316 [Capsicum annuum]|uniref:Uncharacterized protein n=1 Tax=Capsicum annuum TaxID=4072 RepID=A0A2G2YSC5_CAPAN|nr:hypothetical protein FXO37_04736 [Capsicum annuum]PHT72531.1 hypothetical protein T459_23316 [Capsicum annuum]